MVAVRLGVWRSELRGGDAAAVRAAPTGRRSRDCTCGSEWARARSTVKDGDYFGMPTVEGVAGERRPRQTDSYLGAYHDARGAL